MSLRFSSDHRISVLQVTSALDIGGAERVAAALATFMDKTNVSCTACYLKEGGAVADEMERLGVDVGPLPGWRPSRRDFLTSLKLRRLLVDRGIDVIHTHDLHGLIDGSLCRLSLPRLRHVHTFHYGNYANRAPRQQRIERTFWRVPDALVAVGTYQSAAIARLYGIPAHRLRVIYNGVREPNPAPVDGMWPPLPPDVPVIASISTLIPQKGLETLLDAAGILQGDGLRFHLVIAGDGPLRSSLQEKVERQALTANVTFLGWVPDACDKILPACTIFVQSSRWEAMSIVVLEAMAAGKPMAVTTVGDNSRVVLDQQTGLTVPPGDAPALATALERLLRDKQLSTRLGQAARERYSDQFTVQHMVTAHEMLYGELVGTRGRR